MSNDPFAALPAGRRDIAISAILAVLGSTAAVNVRPVTGGVSGAGVFLVEASHRRFVLRLEGQPSPLRNPYQYESMRIAAEAGVAPRIPPSGTHLAKNRESRCARFVFRAR